MNRRINSFYKTKHFLLRQWERNIHDEILYYTLSSKWYFNKKTILIISKKILKKYGLNTNQELFLVVKKKILITCYYSEIKKFVVAQKQIKIDTIIIN